MAARNQSFIPAKPLPWLLASAQAAIRANLALTNQLFVDVDDLEVFRKLPPNSGIVLASNHADETDPQVCLELARRCGIRVMTMCNREAFDEIFGMAGWLLQRLGCFSVKRGAHDGAAKAYATQVVKSGRDVLLIFPEGEIFYLNEEVQPFHNGAVEICLQALLQKRHEQPDWRAFIVPMVIKYHYRESIMPTIENRVEKMEAQLSIKPEVGTPLPRRLMAMQRLLLEREALKYEITMLATSQQITSDIVAIERSIIHQVERRHKDASVAERAGLIDQAWQLAAEIKDNLGNKSDEQSRIEAECDLNLLREAEQLSSWRPHYYMDNATPDRLAEVVLKLERQIFKIKRPKQLGVRSVRVKIAEPMDMEQYIHAYVADAHAVRSSLTKELHARMQALVDELAAGVAAERA